MPEIITQTMSINVDASAVELIRCLKLGHVELVADALDADHAGLTAAVIVQGAQDGVTLDVCNALASALIARRARRCGNSTI